MTKEKTIELMDENIEQTKLLIEQKIQIWLEHVLFTGLWWFGVILSIVPWIIWIMFRKKESSDRILYAGFFVMVISLALNVLGDQLYFWHYRFHVIPVLPTYLPWDLTLMPVSIMLLLQVKPDANPLIKALIFALLSSYVGEPFFHWLKIYQLENWRYTYSVPIQIVIYLIAHYLTRRDRFNKLT